MKWFMNVSIRLKLMLGFGFMWLILAGTVIAAYLAIVGISNSARDLHDVHDTIAVDLVEFRANMNYSRAQILEMMMTSDKAKQDAIGRDIRSTAQGTDAILATLFPARPRSPFPEQTIGIKGHTGGLPSSAQ